MNTDTTHFDCAINEGTYTVHLVGEDEGFGGWAEGKAIVRTKKQDEDIFALTFCFECKHFKDGSKFGIANGRVSRLSISEAGRMETKAYWARCLLNYDRGWDITLEESKKKLDAAYAAILKKFN